MTATCPARAMLVCCASLCVALAGSAPARAAEFIALEDECNGRQLMIRGPIEPGDHQRFVRRLAELVAGGDLPEVQNPDVLWTVKLDSPGGDTEEAMRIGRLLRSAFATTEVGYRFAPRPDGVWDFQRSGELSCLDGEGRLSGCEQGITVADCTGACVLIWLGGAERHANEGRVGLHGLGGDYDESVREYLSDMGVSATWTQRLLEPSPPGDGWLAWPERHALAGRDDALRALSADCPAPLTRDESFQSVAAESAALRERLMARAEAHRQCRRDREAAARATALSWLAQQLSPAGDATVPQSAAVERKRAAAGSES